MNQAAPSLTVHIVDDDGVFRRALSFMLRAASYQPQCWPSGSHFLQQQRPPGTGCMLLDLQMPGKDGLETLWEMRERGFVVPVIVLTGHGDTAAAVNAMKAGAVDLIEKPFDRGALLEMVKAVFDHVLQAERWIAREDQARQKIAALTPREMEVLEGLVRGFPNKTIAYDLGISPRTVEVHRSHVMHKLGAKSFPDALRIAFAAGLGEPFMVPSGLPCSGPTAPDFDLHQHGGAGGNDYQPVCSLNARNTLHDGDIRNQFGNSR
ncbi:response regulator transcription factor [Sphingomonas sp. FW199]|uniref:response regulator transcription factor n=1 Tax=Sphingomonas sp. FW199 TaxID=3400217 RepID=UPI003CE6AB03